MKYADQKQINKRIKGGETFWRDELLEPWLQIKAADPSEIHDRDAYWDQRGRQKRWLPPSPQDQTPVV
ncbi:hypothetical protein SH528x_005458 [Novipirellula sp. SH528]|uniref:hypothetical protein n=1 Tax=Novipirellula sp. SH528 TaxID=3454466 RepID=UPI003F9F20E8